MSTTSGPGVVGRLHADLDALLAVDVPGLPDDAVRFGLRDLVAARNRLDAAIAGWTVSFEVRNLADADGCKTTPVWLNSYCRVSHPAASRMVRYARVMRDLPAVAEAVAGGGASMEHVAKVAGLVKRVGVKRAQEAAPTVGDAAATFEPAYFGVLCNHLADALDPDGPEPTDLFDRRELNLTDVGGMVDIRGQLDPDGGAALREALDALMRPPAPDDNRTAGQRRADALVDLARHALAQGDLPTVGGMPPQVGILLRPETLLYGEDGTDPHTRLQRPLDDDGRRPPVPPGFTDPTDGGGTAGVAAVKAGGGEVGFCGTHLPEGQPDPSHAGDANGTHRHDDGRSQRAGPEARGDPAARSDAAARGGPLHGTGLLPPTVEPAWLNWYGPVSHHLAKRLACDADIWRIVLDPATGLPLDVGRRYRLVPYWIRKALYARDRTCRWPGCQTPAPWCDAHHLDPWYFGGVTKVEDLLLMCRYHHVKLHEGGWRIELDPATGEVQVFRPDGTPHDLGPSQPWTGPTTRRDGR